MSVEAKISFKSKPGYSFDSCLKQFKDNEYDSLVAVTSKPILKFLSMGTKQYEQVMEDYEPKDVSRSNAFRPR